MDLAARPAGCKMSWDSPGLVRAITTGRLRRLLAWAPPRRDVDIFPDDRLLVSYPRSGNTWVRFLIANVMSPDEPATFANIEDRIPDIYKNRGRPLDHVARPRLLKSHESFDPRYGAVIYIVRDPRDVVVSYYHYQRKVRRIRDRFPLDRYVARFVSGTVARYGSWGEHVASWLAAGRGHSAFLLLRYEDLLDHPLRELDRVAAFLHLPRTHRQIAEAVELSSIDRLRTLEAAQADEWITTRGTRKDIPFIRAGSRGGWRSVLSEQSVGQIEAAWGDLMRTFGYELTVAEKPGAGHPADPAPGPPV
jgi:hypothetical protein